jgi:alpha-aminoadipate carrier protein LysW
MQNTALATGGRQVDFVRHFREELEVSKFMVNCPLCDAAMDVDEEELDEGDALICEECGANLHVSGTSPLEITPAKDDDVDDEDEDDLDDDFDEDEDEDEEDEDDEE